MESTAYNWYSDIFGQNYFQLFFYYNLLQILQVAHIGKMNNVMLKKRMHHVKCRGQRTDMSCIVVMFQAIISSSSAARRMRPELGLRRRQKLNWRFQDQGKRVTLVIFVCFLFLIFNFCFAVFYFRVQL